MKWADFIKSGYVYDSNHESAMNTAADDAKEYVDENVMKQPLPSLEDIREAKKMFDDQVSSEGPGGILMDARRSNPDWWDRFMSSLEQDFEPGLVMGAITNQNDRRLAALRMSAGIGGNTSGLRSIPKERFMPAWNAVTNAIGYGSFPVRPRTKQVIVGRGLKVNPK